MNNEEVLQALAHLIGTTYDENTRDTVMRITGRVGVLGPGDIRTLQLDPNRITIRANSDSLIEGFAFG
ncbi:hypothetical protein ACIPZF_17250 [Pseudomonas sp. NPDC089752]|uniref:hypothetical protein n=1 Tax=Pseudomonas sp. NPDC089752 TaxID=3364472 RepID=UPI00381CF613